MKLMRDRRPVEPLAPDPYAGLVQIHASPCYDLIVSLRVLYNPRIYGSARAWVAATRAVLPPDIYQRGRFFFQGQVTGLGYGAMRLIPTLGRDAGPDELIQAVREADPIVLALYMLDTGETSAETLEVFEQHLARRGDTVACEAILHGFTPQWARRCRRVLTDPTGVQADLIALLEHYTARAFSTEAPQVVRAATRAVAAAEEMLTVLPTLETIERLTGGYTLGGDLELHRIILVPSAFIHPFVASRVDERAGEALIIYGIQTDVFLKYDPVPLDPNLVRSLKALADPGRLKVLRLLGHHPMYGPELVTALGLSQPTVHHHLAQLRAAGLVRQERMKGGMKYTLRHETAATTVAALEQLLIANSDAEDLTTRVPMIGHGR